MNKDARMWRKMNGGVKKRWRRERERMWKVVLVGLRICGKDNKKVDE